MAEREDWHRRAGEELTHSDFGRLERLRDTDERMRTLTNTVQALVEEVRAQRVEQHEVEGVLKAHIDREEQMLAAAFPDGDVNGHRAAHESMMRASAAQEKFWQELKVDLAKKSLWGLMMVLVGLLMIGITTGKFVGMLPFKP